MIVIQLTTPPQTDGVLKDFNKIGWKVRARTHAALVESNYRKNNSTLNKIKLEEKEICLQ
jgi:hypothetical protein